MRHNNRRHTIRASIREFVMPPIDDEVIGDVLVRSAVLRKLTADEIRDFVLREVKPLMGVEEIIHLELDIEVHIEQDGS